MSRLWVGKGGFVLLAALSAGCGPTEEEIIEREKLVVLRHAKGMVEDMDTELTKLMVLGTRSQLKDPDSAKFRGLRIVGVADDDGNRVGGKLCGEINAKNSMGGYTGFRPFYTDYMDDEFSVRIFDDDDDPDHFASMYRLSCDRTRSVPTP